MSTDVIRATGGFITPVRFTEPQGLHVAMRELPLFAAALGGIDYRPSHVRWAEERELELREQRQAREAERVLAAEEWPWP